ncbi:histidinol-phosphate transaminase [Streptomyces sp. YIM 98790]|uniref:pyridoxal phosphate-dependent aminotransferase n=1 Tax=Streptomyces sp. YIM 98790 TaxID=2689077 RepID=UPI00140D7567|nr:histidinol-phosphate transaminase [Streptomyces sp. YIM 98790]
MTVNRVRIDRHVAASRPYVPDWLGMDRSAYLCLDRNESTRPVPDHVVRALTDYVTNVGVQWYPGDAELYPALAEYCGVTPDHFLATNGSDQAIEIALRGFLRERDELLVATPAFAMFPQVAGVLGAVVSGVPYREGSLEFPYREFRAAAARRPRVIAFINPNNPTGTPVDLAFIEEIARAYPDIPVIVDEAYYEFTGVTAVPLISECPNIIVFRTFSKAFAMAGLRVGYLVADPELIQEFGKIRGPFDVNAPAIVAARAHLGSVGEVLLQAKEMTDQVKPMVVDRLTELGAPVVAGAANFCLVRPPDCREAVTFLRESGILVRVMSAGALTGMFRVSMGTRQEMERFCAVYGAYHRGPGSAS